MGPVIKGKNVSYQPKRKHLPLNSQGLAHYILPLGAILLVGIVGTYLLVASRAAPTTYPGPRTISNPYTSQCPGNKVKFGTPKGRTATAAARQKVFGKPHPNANTEPVQFMGQTVHMHRGVAPCLRAVEWDLKNVYRTKYKLRHAFGLSMVDANSPTSYFHPYGAAIDINPAENPMCGTPCPRGAPHRIPASWVKAFRAHGFYWGGNFPHHKDYMHFE